VSREFESQAGLSSAARTDQRDQARSGQYILELGELRAAPDKPRKRDRQVVSPPRIDGIFVDFGVVGWSWREHRVRGAGADPSAFKQRSFVRASQAERLGQATHGGRVRRAARPSLEVGNATPAQSGALGQLLL